MLTNADIKKLKGVFATKDDLLAMEKRQNKKYATKEDLVAMEKRQDKKYATKDDMKTMENRIKKDIVGDIVGYMQDNVLPLLNEHDKRLDRLEKRVGGFPPLA